jgi:5-formyltetrahydrofolate cyclo-ligase
VKKAKKDLRKKILEGRQSCKDELSQKVTRPHIICEKILSLEKFQKAKNVLLYYPIESEVDIKEVIEYCWECGKNVYFPFIKEVVIGKANSYLELRGTGKYWEPIGKDVGKGYGKDIGKDDSEILDVIIVPGLAFDNAGYRLGQGMGWYDKYISSIKFKFKKKPYIIGVCFKEQLLENIPHESHDIKMDEVLWG